MPKQDTREPSAFVQRLFRLAFNLPATATWADIQPYRKAEQAKRGDDNTVGRFWDQAYEAAKTRQALKRRPRVGLAA